MLKRNFYDTLCYVLPASWQDEAREVFNSHASRGRQLRAWSFPALWGQENGYAYMDVVASMNAPERAAQLWEIDGEIAVEI